MSIYLVSPWGARSGIYLEQAKILLDDVALVEYLEYAFEHKYFPRRRPLDFTTWLESYAVPKVWVRKDDEGLRLLKAGDLLEIYNRVKSPDPL